MAQALYDRPAVLTSFAFRQEYFPELDGMLATVKEHHPDWPIVVGRGPLPDCEGATLELETPSGKDQWTLPVPLNLDNSDNDWRKITRMKGWWLSQVWHHYGRIAETLCHRVLWLDADARLNGPLDFEIDPGAELIAGPWWDDPDKNGYDTITSGLLLFQGVSGGSASTLLDSWGNECVQQIKNLRAPTVPWLDGDQEVLTEELAKFLEERSDLRLLKLDYDKYCGVAFNNGDRFPGALVDQWQMSRKMKRKDHQEPNWPPPEHLRRDLRK